MSSLAKDMTFRFIFADLEPHQEIEMRQHDKSFSIQWLVVSLFLVSTVCGCLVTEATHKKTLQEMETCRKDTKRLRTELKEVNEMNGILQEKANNLEEENKTLLEEMASLSVEQQEMARKIAIYKKQVDTREPKADREADTYKNLLERLSPEIQEGNIRVDQADTRLKLNLVDKILFPSGSATLTQKGKLIIEKVGYALKETKDRKIMIEGHTDDQPLNPALKKVFDSNWDLSAKRATAVVQHLQEKVGIDPRLLSASGYSMYSPIVENSSPQNRQLNRRIEIVLVPLSPKELQRFTSVQEFPTPSTKATSDPVATPPVLTPVLP
jgi:chemotaxis protein MotB